MNKVLVVAGHSRDPWKWGIIGEAVRKLLDNPNNEVYYLDCHGKCHGYCGLNLGKHIGYCNKCYPMCLKIINRAGIKKENIFEIKKYNYPKFPKFNSIKEALEYNYEGYNLGLGPVSCIMTLTRDYNFDIKKWNKDIKKFFETEYLVIENIKELHKTYNFNELCLFNGRMPFVYSALAFAKKHNILYTTYTSAANVTKIRALKNTVPHDFNNWKKEVSEYWQKDDENKIELADKWFKDRRAGKFQALESYTKDQIKDSLPKNWDETKENIVFFNSSIDEVYAFDSWKHPFKENENKILKEMFEHYKNDETKHFYLRIHPNLTRAKKKKTTQIREINEFKKLYKNLTVIEPDEKVDTYALIESASKVITSFSTIGCEATYWGRVSILAGKAPYEDFNCVYKAHSMEELYKLIDNKNLTPKPKEEAYPYEY